MNKRKYYDFKPHQVEHQLRNLNQDQQEVEIELYNKAFENSQNKLNKKIKGCNSNLRLGKALTIGCIVVGVPTLLLSFLNIGFTTLSIASFMLGANYRYKYLKEKTKKQNLIEQQQELNQIKYEFEEIKQNIVEYNKQFEKENYDINSLIQEYLDNKSITAEPKNNQNQEEIER